MVPTSNAPPTRTPSTGSASADDRHENDENLSDENDDGVQGEGDYKAAREFNEAERKFVASGKVPAAARAAAPKSEAERREMIAAEAEGKRRAKDERTALSDAWPEPVTPRVPRKDADQDRG